MQMSLVFTSLCRIKFLFLRAKFSRQSVDLNLNTLPFILCFRECLSVFSLLLIHFSSELFAIGVQVAVCFLKLADFLLTGVELLT